MAAITGILVRDLLLGRPPVLDLEPVSPARFRRGTGASVEAVASQA
jgi:glycine/D-amino acid oxidase-like deaminating enzyme